MKKLNRLTLFLCIVFVMFVVTACGKKTVHTEIDEEEVSETDIGSKNGFEDVVLEIPACEMSSNVIKSGDIYFFITSNSVAKYNSVTQEYTWLYRDESIKRDVYSDSTGYGLLVNDKIYFTQTIYDEGTDLTGDYQKTLSMVDIQGNAYSVIDKLPKSDNFAGAGSLLLMDGMIYTDIADSFSYQLDAEGDVERMISPEEIEANKSIPEGYSLCTYNSDGVRALFPVYTIAQAGVVIAQGGENYESYCIDAVSGEKSVLPGAIISSSGTQLLLNEFDDEGRCQYGIYDMKDRTYRSLIKKDDYLNVFDMDDSYAYYVALSETSNKATSEYYRISISDGSEELIGTYDREEDALDYTQSSAFDMSVDKELGELYTVCSHDYAMYYAIYEINSKKMMALPVAYYDSGISKIGSLVSTFKQYREDENDDNSKLLVTLDVKVLNIGDSYEGASKINKVMNEYAKTIKAEADRNYKELMQDEYRNEEYFIPYSFDNSLMEISYNDEDYICLVQSGYDYMGGAHGMPYKESFVFNLCTGYKLELEDLVGVEEDKLKDIVVKAFKEQCYDGNEAMYWDDAVDSVRQYTDYAYTEYYLTDEGIRFYYDPYLLASFAAGFIEVDVPYEDLDMKIF